MEISIEIVTLMMLGALLLLMLLGQPLAFITLSIAVVGALVFVGPNALPLLASRIYAFVTEPVLIAVPIFVLMATILERSGVAKDIYDAMYVWAGALNGGVAIQTMIVAVLLAAITGIVGGEVVMLGLVALPQLLRLGYNKHLALGILASGGALGTMIPPSIVLILYGLTAGVSTGQLFIAAVIPGLVLASLYILYIFVMCQLNPTIGPGLPKEECLPLLERIKHLKKMAGPLLIAVWILGSIYTGIASVTESAGIGCVAAMGISFFRKKLTRETLHQALITTMDTCGRLFWLSFGAAALIGVFNIVGGSKYLVELMSGLSLGPTGIILVMMAILIVLGMFMDWIGILILTMPIFVPIIKMLGFDPVWFGILFCLNMQMSFISPPFGPACFYLKSVAPPEISLGDIFRGVLPFMLIQIAALGLLISFPELATWLPSILSY
ncbi:C4-dicarboxylate ABC transporter permease [Kiloniella litopenaei]|uniref:TRAP transporter large permease protein n=1 Tax=Kiloniella litopenaei TaxID=1549748 RepID=A0A0M2RAD2_9PROT|nr:TRAP transporter large permease subunit [Kiloniella litopenaei]KKJ78782.1 C4-dicarboxylate ABC transporter permease [Kiloniella litopenaei]